MKLSIAICDDNMQHSNIIENYMYELDDSNVECDTFQSGEELVYAYKNNNERYDVIFLDMEMKKLNGIETANIIREFDEYVIIVFITSYKEYMQESFQCAPFRFLVKPVAYDELKTVFNDIRRKLSKRKTIFYFAENKMKVRLYCRDIIYCESQAHWIIIHTKDEDYKICKSMSDVYDMLDKDMFYKIHKSFIINFHYVKTIKGNDIELYHCDKLLPISRSCKKEVLLQYTNFMERNLYV